MKSCYYHVTKRGLMNTVQSKGQFLPIRTNYKFLLNIKFLAQVHEGGFEQV